MKPVLFLDVMSTLVYDPFHVEMPQFFGMSLEELMREKHPTAWIEFECGKLSEQEFLDNFFADRRSYDQQAFLTTVQKAYRFLPGIEEILTDLAQQGAIMHTMSNYPQWYHHIEERLFLSRWMPWTFVSCDWGLRKPDPRSYTGLLTHLALKPAQVLFVDDNGSNCAAAAELGMQAIVFRDATQLRQELRDFGF